MAKKIDVIQKITDSLKNQSAVERALVVLEDGNLWMYEKGTRTSSRAKYLANWVKSGKKLSGHFLEEARAMALEHVSRLVRPSLERSRQVVKEQEERIAFLKQWIVACEGELNKLPFPQPLPEPQETLIDDKPVSQVCYEEGLY